jgi:periplasmic protein TonB
MFSNLIESGSHSADLRRKGKFFLGASVFYAALLAATGIGSIYAYNAKLDTSDDYELLSILRFTPADASAEPQRRPQQQHPAAPNSREQRYATRTEISINTPYHSDRVASAEARDIDPHTPVVIGRVNTDAVVPGGPVGDRFVAGTPDGTERGAPMVEDVGATPPPPPARVAPTPAPTPRKEPLHLSTSVLTGKAISMPPPPYPATAKQLGIQGSVAVQVSIDEQGRVLSAKATSGHPMLMPAAVQAAYRAHFTPTLLSGQPTKVTGVITYNFVLNR